MSYCRWSTDDFNCDLYCYGDASGGWTTHVRRNRIVGEVPHVNYWLLSSETQPEQDEFYQQYEAQQTYLDTCERTLIGLEHDGESFHDGSLEDFRNRLLMLRAAGYRFPAEVLAQVAAEIAERDGGSGGRHSEMED